MNKKTIIPIVIILLILGGAFWYSLSRHFNPDNTTITYVSNRAENKKVVLQFTKTNASMKTYSSGDERQQGISASEREKITENLDRLYVRGNAPANSDACKQDEQEVNSWIEIDDGTVKGIRYFCDGIDVDEEGNIHGPVQDILREIEFINRGQS